MLKYVLIANVWNIWLSQTAEAYPGETSSDKDLERGYNLSDTCEIVNP